MWKLRASESRGWWPAVWNEEREKFQPALKSGQDLERQRLGKGVPGRKDMGVGKHSGQQAEATGRTLDRYSKGREQCCFSISEGIRLLPGPSLLTYTTLLPSFWPLRPPWQPHPRFPQWHFLHICNPVTKAKTGTASSRNWSSTTSNAHSVGAVPTPHQTRWGVRGLCLSSLGSGQLTKTVQRKGRKMRWKRSLTPNPNVL